MALTKSLTFCTLGHPTGIYWLGLNIYRVQFFLIQIVLVCMAGLNGGSLSVVSNRSGSHRIMVI